MDLLPHQSIVQDQNLDERIFLEGLAGSGKTTAGAARLLRLLKEGVPGDEILVVVPQRTLGEPYYDLIRSPSVDAGGVVSVLTVGGLARRCIHLFWPLMANEGGFRKPEAEPIFLTLETAQYYMAHLVRPLLDEGYFESVSINRNRLYSQILDNLNKAAVVGFEHSQIGERLKSSWMGEPSQLHVYDEAQECANLFRTYCLEHNLLDFSLQMELFLKILWPAPYCRQYLVRNYRHIIYDNLEEDSPAAQELIGEWVAEVDSALIIYDWDAGYRRFLGADPRTGYKLKDLCNLRFVFDESQVQSPEIRSLSDRLTSKILPHGLRKEEVVARNNQANQEPVTVSNYDLSEVLVFENHRFFPQMLDWVVNQIGVLVHDQGIPADEIVVLAPFLSDALRFSLVNRLERIEIPVRTHRPSRSLREQPATQCLLALVKIAYSDWGYFPSKYDLAYALMSAIEGIDLVRAQLLTEIVFRKREGIPALTSFDRIRPRMQERITYRFGERYERLRLWLEESKGDPGELDHFLSRLFGEILSQPGFGFHDNFDYAEVTANLIESVQKFRRAVGISLTEEGVPVGKEYLAMVQDGVIAAQYIRGWRTPPGEAVLLAPAYTFLMSNKSVDTQFWLDIGSRSWSQRLFQPLTHPYVLSRSWEFGRLWTDSDEVNVEQEALYNLVLGLTRRCRRQIFLGLSDLSEQGYEQRGQLLKSLQRVLREVET